MSDKDQDKSADSQSAKAQAAEKPKAAPPAAEKPPWSVDPVAPEWRGEDEDALVQALQESHPEAVLEARSYAGDLTLRIKREHIAEVSKSLKEEHGFHYMTDIAGVDYSGREERFEVVYHVYNHDKLRLLRMCVSTDEEIPVPTVSGVWRGANWPEREVYDMYGVRFDGHPDMTRILLWEGFNGYPLRKDFPVEGIDTGAAIYPEYYHEEQGPIAGTGTGWKPPKPPESEAESATEDADKEETS